VNLVAENDDLEGSLWRPCERQNHYQLFFVEAFKSRPCGVGEKSRPGIFFEARPG
jgi:hypothetical protein